MKNGISLLLIHLLAVTFFSNCSNNSKEYREDYKKYFDGSGTVFTTQDSANAIKYNQRLFDLYSKIDEFYYKGKLPYNLIYQMNHYDTTLLYWVLDLYVVKVIYTSQFCFLMYDLLKDTKFILNLFPYVFLDNNQFFSFSQFSS